MAPVQAPPVLFSCSHQLSIFALLGHSTIMELDSANHELNLLKQGSKFNFSSFKSGHEELCGSDGNPDSHRKVSKGSTPLEMEIQCNLGGSEENAPGGKFIARSTHIQKVRQMASN